MAIQSGELTKVKKSSCVLGSFLGLIFVQGLTKFAILKIQIDRGGFSGPILKEMRHHHQLSSHLWHWQNDTGWDFGRELLHLNSLIRIFLDTLENMLLLMPLLQQLSLAASKITRILVFITYGLHVIH